MSCNKPNTAKRDRLPAKEYLDLILTRNQKLTESTQLKPEIHSYSPLRLQELNQYAEVNGFTT